MTPIAYLATPYSDYIGGPQDAFVYAARLAGRLLKAGIGIYCPVVHGHILETYGDIEFTHEEWMRVNDPMLDAAYVLIVAHMHGWDKSRGIAYEVKFFEDHDKPIFDLVDLDTLRLVKRSKGNGR